jgi:broad specificity phosphatase PhoE
MSAIFFLRHAQGSFGTHNYDRLSAIGERQAVLAGQYLLQTAAHARRVITGSLSRQKETAVAIADSFRGLASAPTIEIDTRLNEVGFESQMAHILPAIKDPAENLSQLLDEAHRSSRAYQKLLRRTFLHWQRLSDLPTPLETWQQFSNRVRSIVEEIKNRSGPGEATIVVTSGAIVATVVQQLLALPDAGAYPLFEVMMNCSVTHLMHDRHRISLVSFNESSYLAAGEASGMYGELRTYR